ncbi:MAG: DNA mismatch repair protein MutS [Alphaproteobacteria bacterium]|nr:DNA mismatch repair protein MutS [Alphaproteobacteria bacterium]
MSISTCTPKMPSLTPIMAQYLSIKEENPDCLLFFRLGDFYELFLEDAKIASQALDIILTRRHKNGAEDIPMCGVPAHASESYIARLIKKGFRVAICEQMEQSTAKSKGPIHREVVRIITPGTLTEETLLNARAHNFLMALYPQEKSFSLACVDISTGDFFIESHHSSDLSSVLHRIMPQEILLPEPCLNRDDIQSIWHDWKSKIQPLALPRFDRGEERLTSFFNIQTMESFGSFSTIELAAAGALLDYVLITQKKNSLLLSHPKKIEPSDCLELDGFTRRNLEITTTFSGEKTGSLLHTIDETITPMGGRLLAMRLSNPLKNLTTLQERQNSVRFFVNNNSTRNVIRELFKTIPDMDRALSRLFLRRGTPKDLGALRAGLQVLPAITEALSHHQSSLGAELRHLFHAFHTHTSLLERLDHALMKELPAQLRDGMVFAQGYDAVLDQARENHGECQDILQELQRRYSAETGITHLRIKRNAIIGYYIEIPPASAGKMPFHFILKQTLVSSYRYTTPELLAMEQRRASSTDAAYARECQLFEEIVIHLCESADQLRETLNAIAVYDVSCALAELAEKYGYTCPILDYSTTFEIEGGRHAVVERVLNNAFVSNDCALYPERPIWILTGPNMAGKSTFLRQNALIALLAHVGSFVPATTAHIGIIDRIFSRVGASDDLARGHSTFMVEMIETATILNKATTQSFVILDEVGRGTSTHDGLALAWACIEYLDQHLPCRTFFATHYHELSGLQHMEKLGFYTMEIKEWERKVVFFHKIKPGVADQSYGLNVARLAGIPDAIIHRAEAILSTLQPLPLTPATQT